MSVPVSQFIPPRLHLYLKPHEKPASQFNFENTMRDRNIKCMRLQTNEITVSAELCSPRFTKQNSVFACLAGPGLFECIVSPDFKCSNSGLSWLSPSLSFKPSSNSPNTPSTCPHLWLSPIVPNSWTSLPFLKPQRIPLGRRVSDLYLQSYSSTKLNLLGKLILLDLRTLNHKCPKQIITFTYTWIRTGIYLYTWYNLQRSLLLLSVQHLNCKSTLTSCLIPFYIPLTSNITLPHPSVPWNCWLLQLKVYMFPLPGLLSPQSNPNFLMAGSSLSFQCLFKWHFFKEAFPDQSNLKLPPDWSPSHLPVLILCISLATV